MNTILITGTCQIKTLRTSINRGTEIVAYDIYIWGSRHGYPLQFITSTTIECGGYNYLWPQVKQIAANHLSEPRMDDGAYTQFLEHLIPKP